MEEFIIKDYREFLEENELENTENNIDIYISGLYYELLNDIEINREDFKVPKDFTDNGAIEYIERQIKNVLLKGVR